jgi:hypothetical protein
MRVLIEGLTVLTLDTAHFKAMGVPALNPVGSSHSS